MTPAPSAIEDALAREPFDRALAWRARSFWIRTAWVLVIAGLSIFSPSHDLLAGWLAITLVLGALDARLSAWLLDRPKTRAAVVLVSASHVACSGSFAAVAVLLSRPPTPVHLAEAVLALCAACLNNAMMCCGSRLATFTLVTPSAGLLIAGPLLARLVGYRMSAPDVLLTACAGAAFTIFVVRMAQQFYDKGVALKVALEGLARHSASAVVAGREAQESRQRWRMIFEHSPMARLCFNASALYDALDAGGELAGAKLGDRLAARFGSLQEVFEQIVLLEKNQVAIDLCGEDLGRRHFTEASLPAFCAALNAISDDGVLPAFPAELICADGRILDVDVHFRMAPDQSAPWSLCLATYSDVTEARRAARAQREALEAAEIANRAKSEFLAVISHEIRTPLNGVLGMAQAMALNPLSKMQRQRLRVIGESGSALLAIVDDLLDLSRIEAGGLELTPQDCDLQTLVEGVYAAYAGEAVAKGLTFLLDIDPGAAGLFQADAGRVRQILGNLVANALKFTHEGEVLLRLSRTANGVRMEVRDTGIGIAPDRVAGLFETFAQADSSMTRRYGGAGLGLAICRQLTRAMGGDVTVASTPGRGSTFSVELPLILSQPAPRPAILGAAGLPAEPLRVLAAEDNPVNQMVLKALLAQIGVEPVIVENGLEAVRAWEDAEWDVILMDVQMPQMDGVTATRKIRAREAELGRAPTPIVAVTANAMIHQVADYLAAGMSEVVAKPINVEALFSAILAAVTLSELQPAKTATVG
ncbi:MAG TPA: ATP-binding protein [Phenylobacterium sp.]|jgi:signal transduction histidine kinase/ActR/RegA family two-component response regulator|uniref:hybrid sensor histidine kinase/response regulator n=1 Tax=Phenylobacterium sp. TaxID=1871053 RepID=UPI002D391507|nr:ATP-binding protein [Phenylobacterium sp.]HZZ68216.1 ATP-binding protein [Phenylobacterium sp.]